MAGFEDLIRGALQKHGGHTPESRAAIYQSSRQALERMLSQNQKLDLAAQTYQRQRLEMAIADIEAGYKAAPQVGFPDPPPNQPSPYVAPPHDSHQQQPASGRVEPGFGAEPASVQQPHPSMPAAPQPNPAEGHYEEPGYEEEEDDRPARLEDFQTDFESKPRRESKPYAKLLLWTIILVGVGVSIWWAINFGPAFVQQQLGGSVPNPGQTISSGSFNPGNEDDWTTAFAPADDLANVQTGNSGTADLFRNGNQSFVRLASNPGSSGNTLKIKIPRGVLLPLKGEAATIEILVKNTNETPHQFAIFCEFGAMGDCGRKRFTVSNKLEAQIFDVIINNTVLPAGEDAFLSFDTDLGGEGRQLDLYSIRVRING